MQKEWKQEIEDCKEKKDEETGEVTKAAKDEYCTFYFVSAKWLRGSSDDGKAAGQNVNLPRARSGSIFEQASERFLTLGCEDLSSDVKTWHQMQG